MRIDFTHVLLDAEDAPVQEEGIPVSIAKVLKRAVLAIDDKDKKLELFELFLKLKTADSDTDFSIQEIALLDKAISVYPVLIYGQLHYLLSNKQTQ